MKQLALLFVLFSEVFAGVRVTAVMITGKDPFHHALALCSIRSFLEQTYPDKRLLIVNDGEQLFEFPEGSPIEEIKVEKGLTLGELRNLALQEIEENEIWVQWDDDDWHHPKAIAGQLRELLSKKADLCCMTSQVRYAFKINAAWVAHGMIQGTMMCRKKSAIVYPAVEKGEDSSFFHQYQRRYKMAGWSNPPHYYLRFIHGHNTWGEEFFGLDERKQDEWKIEEEAKRYLSEVLGYYPSSETLFWWRRDDSTRNFGDELSPLIVERIVGRKISASSSADTGRLLAIGSILHYAKNGDIVWGSGVNGKIKRVTATTLDVRAVRGPLTRKFLMEQGIKCPEIYGDPALLLPLLFPELKPVPVEDFIVIPNLNEIEEYQGLPHLVLPTDDCFQIIQKILGAKLVISGALHGIIVAEAFGIPAVHLRITNKEPLFKYQDYYLGTGRKTFKMASSLEEALRLGGEVLPKCDLEKLLNSFPYERFL